MRVCIVGASGKLGKHIVEHALDRGYDVVAVCREQSVGKLDAAMSHARRLPVVRKAARVACRFLCCPGLIVLTGLFVGSSVLATRKG